jgi:hypothetical protein
MAGLKKAAMTLPGSKLSSTSAIVVALARRVCKCSDF